MAYSVNHLIHKTPSREEQKKIEPKRLPALIWHNKQGFEYLLVKREGNVALYEARYLNGSELTGFVVIKIRIKKATILPSGRINACREVFPSPSEFGKRAWFYMPKSRSASEAHYTELVEEK